MDTFDRCPKCHEFGWNDTHKCHPFKVQLIAIVENGYDLESPPSEGIEEYTNDGWSTFYAQDAAGAAQSFADSWDSDDRGLASQFKAMRVEVQAADGQIEIFQVYCELNPIYTARKLQVECDRVLGKGGAE